jgi:hypothetical protein
MRDAAGASAVADSPPAIADDRPRRLLRCTVSPDQPGRWAFELLHADGALLLEAEDVDPEFRGEPLELLTVIRGLEALDRPAHVTLIGASRYVRQGIRYGLPEWRRSGWRWEWFGQMVPIRHEHLWRRLDQALRFHRVKVRQVNLPHWRVDPAHSTLAGPKTAPHPPVDLGGRDDSADCVIYGVLDRLSAWIGPMIQCIRRWQLPIRRWQQLPNHPGHPVAGFN